MKVLESMREDALLKISAQFCQFSGQFLKNSLFWWRRFRAAVKSRGNLVLMCRVQQETGEVEVEEKQ